jgi:hypothetical protein
MTFPESLKINLKKDFGINFHKPTKWFARCTSNKLVGYFIADSSTFYLDRKDVFNKISQCPIYGCPFAMFDDYGKLKEQVVFLLTKEGKAFSNEFNYFPEFTSRNMTLE